MKELSNGDIMIIAAIIIAIILWLIWGYYVFFIKPKHILNQKCDKCDSVFDNVIWCECFNDTDNKQVKQLKKIYW